MRTPFKFGDEVIIDVGWRGTRLRGVKGIIQSTHPGDSPNMYDFYLIKYTLNNEESQIVLSNKDLFTKEEYLKIELDKSLS